MNNSNKTTSKKNEEPKLQKMIPTTPETLTNFTTPKQSQPATKKSMIRYQEAIEEEELEHMIFTDTLEQ